MNAASPVLSGPRRAGFTLIELLTAMTITTVLVVCLMKVADRTGAVWVQGESQIEKRRNARAILEMISRDLRNAILPVSGVPAAGHSNLRFLLNPPGANLAPELLNRDALFWQTTTATDVSQGDVAEVGYFVRYGLEEGSPQFRLCRFFVNAAEQADYKIYDPADSFSWLSAAILDTYTSASATAADKYRGLLADGVIGFWVRCLDPEGNAIAQTAVPAGSYDSDAGYSYTGADGTVAADPPALPAAVEVSMVILDSRSALRLTAAEADQIRTGYSQGDPASFIATLPESIRGAARIVSSKIVLPKS